MPFHFYGEYDKRRNAAFAIAAPLKRCVLRLYPLDVTTRGNTLATRLGAMPRSMSVRMIVDGKLIFAGPFAQGARVLRAEAPVIVQRIQLELGTPRNVALDVDGDPIIDELELIAAHTLLESGA